MNLPITCTTVVWIGFVQVTGNQANQVTLSIFSSVLTSCPTLSPGTWRPSLWSRCSSIPLTTPENQATSVTRRPPPSGTTRRWQQTGTGSTLVRRRSKVKSRQWHKTLWAGIRHLRLLARPGMNCKDTEKRLVVISADTWKDTWTETSHLVTHIHSKTESTVLLYDGTARNGNKQKKNLRRGQTTDLCQKLYLFPVCLLLCMCS